MLWHSDSVLLLLHLGHLGNLRDLRHEMISLHVFRADRPVVSSLLLCSRFLRGLLRHSNLSLHVLHLLLLSEMLLHLDLLLLLLSRKLFHLLLSGSCILLGHANLLLHLLLSSCLSLSLCLGLSLGLSSGRSFLLLSLPGLWNNPFSCGQFSVHALRTDPVRSASFPLVFPRLSSASNSNDWLLVLCRLSVSLLMLHHCPLKLHSHSVNMLPVGCSLHHWYSNAERCAWLCILWDRYLVVHTIWSSKSDTLTWNSIWRNMKKHLLHLLIVFFGISRSGGISRLGCGSARRVWIGRRLGLRGLLLMHLRLFSLLWVVRLGLLLSFQSLVSRRLEVKS
mmetsp:Transcript_9245/g.17959  ORF Transcript_9245/g.17959 Transcript_9245/m.17959 type:complete len:336 (+) Transcript_9245:481-1488(+)